MKEIKLGQKCYRAINPEFTTDGSCVLPCTVMTLYIEKYFDIDNELQEEVTHVEISYGTFDEPDKIKADSLFNTEEEAYLSVEELLKNEIAIRENKIKGFEQHLVKIRELKEK